MVNQKFAGPMLGRELFHSGKEEGLVSSSEVTR
jgi:hypothetical protein